MKLPVLILQLKFMITVLDFISDFYYFRNLDKSLKEKKMLRVGNMRILLTDKLDEEIKELEIN